VTTDLKAAADSVRHAQISRVSPAKSTPLRVVLCCWLGHGHRFQTDAFTVSAGAAYSTFTCTPYIDATMEFVSFGPARSALAIPVAVSLADLRNSICYVLDR